MGLFQILKDSWLDAANGLRTHLVDASGNAFGVSGNGLRVDSVGSGLAVAGTAADGATAVGHPVQVGGKDGSGNIQTVLTDASGNVIVNLGFRLDATNDTVGVVGVVPHGSADTGSPIKIGGKAFDVEPASVGSTERVNGWYDLVGRLHVFNDRFANHNQIASSGNNSVASVTLTAVANKRYYITKVTASYSATAVGQLTLTDAGVTFLQTYIHGAREIDFPVPWRCGLSTIIAAALSNGGSAIFGNVTIMGYSQ
jgi:hypothetical protein